MEVVLASFQKASQAALADESIFIWADFRILEASIIWRRALEDREAAYSILMDLVRYLPPFPYSVPSEIVSRRSFAAAALGHWLLRDFKDPQRDDTARKNILNRLEQLTHMEHVVVRHREQDTRLFFARALHLTGDHSKAREVLKGHLSLAMKDALPADPYDEEWQRKALLRIANVFAHLDDDDNANAAWSLLRLPVRRVTPMTSATIGVEGAAEGQSHQSSEAAEAGRNDHAAVEDEGSKHLELKSQAAASAHSEQHSSDGANGIVNPPLRARDVVASKATFEDADNGEEKTINFDGSNHDAKPSLLNDEESGLSTLQKDANNDPDESDEIRGYCDGCEKEPLYNDEFYQCRDCLDVLFCADCYAKFQAGELYRLLCMPTCSHLRLPALERRTEDRFGLDAPVVRRGEKISLVEWFAEIREEWGIEGLEFRAREKFREVALKVRVGLRLDGEFKAKLEQAALEKGLEMPVGEVAA